MAAMRDPSHPEHEALQQWSGCETWDLAHIDILAANHWLDNIRRQASRQPFGQACPQPDASTHWRTT